MKDKKTLFEIGTVLILSFAIPAVGIGQGVRSDQSPAVKSQPTANKDEEAIRKTASEFSDAFAKGDAKAIAAMWAEDGEYQDDGNKLLRGRQAIEQAYTEQFAEKSGGKIGVEVQSVRFLTPDVAVEEGLLHETSDGRDLPSTSRYSAIDVREDGKWKIAQCREWGGGQDHLDDLNWLVGKWKASAKEGDLTISFAWDEKQPILIAKLSKGASGSESGSVKVGYDPRRGLLHSWHSDEDGGHGEALWHRDGNQWVMNATGLTADGKETSAQNMLTRIDNNNLIWRSINRRLGGQQVPDTMPIKLTRVTEDK
jgi:uncharacterized protein (TIGR02246 family)